MLRADRFVSSEQSSNALSSNASKYPHVGASSPHIQTLNGEISFPGLDNGLLGHLEVWFIAFPNPQPLPSQSKRCTSFGDLFDHPEQNTAFLDKQITKALCILTPSISSVSCNSIRPMEQGTCNEASGSKAGEFITAVGDLPQAVILQMEVKGS